MLFRDHTRRKSRRLQYGGGEELRDFFRPSWRRRGRNRSIWGEGRAGVDSELGDGDVRLARADFEHGDAQTETKVLSSLCGFLSAMILDVGFGLVGHWEKRYRGY